MAAPRAPRDTYHHGDLRRTLVSAAEELLAERGADGFSLREVARRAGVSPAAPAHHFGDSAGLLTAVATLGFEELAQSLLAGHKGAGSDPRARLVGQGVGYVRFALAYPGRFGLMFRDGPRRDDPALAAAASRAFQVLEDDIRGPARHRPRRAARCRRARRAARHVVDRARLRPPRHRRPLRVAGGRAGIDRWVVANLARASCARRSTASAIARREGAAKRR